MQREVARIVHVLGHQHFQRIEIEGERDAELLLEPWRDPRRDLAQPFRNALGRQQHLRLHQRDQHEEQQEHEQTEQEHDDRRRHCAGMTPRHRPIHERRAKVGENRADQERCQHPAQIAQREEDDQRRAGEPEVVARGEDPARWRRGVRLGRDFAGDRRRVGRGDRHAGRRRRAGVLGQRRAGFGHFR